MAKEMSRRTFLKQGAAAAIGLAVVPSTVLGKKFGYTAPSDKLNILGVGVGGRGASVLKGLESQNIIGLCDVDWKYADHIFKRYPAAKKFNDYRKMYDEMLKSADAVMVATADHTHAIIAADAITAGKHVYCEKPLTHTVYESRLLTKLADKYKVATQMGNQGASAEGVRKVCEWIWNGEIGEVRRVDTFTDRPIWPQGLARPEEDMRIPKTMNWDAFIGPAPYRPYNAAYTPWNFRGWWDFGTGALGDMACHILHPVFKGLKLGYPTKVEGSSTLLLNESAPSAQRVKFIFPARDNMPKVAMPEVEVHWYDGGLMPERPAGLPAGKNLNVSTSMLEQAKMKAIEAELVIDFIEADIRMLDLQEKFDLIFIPFNSIHHLYRNEDLFNALGCVRNHLKVGGLFLLDCFNPNIQYRSEERRVGKECRSRWSPYH